MTVLVVHRRQALRVTHYGRPGNGWKRWTHEVVATHPDGRAFVVKRCTGEVSARKALALAIRRTSRSYGVKVVGPAYTTRPYELSR